MRIFLRGGPRREIELLTGRDARNAGDVPIELDSELAAVDFLSHFACDQRSMTMLRRVVVEDRLCSSASSLDDHDVLRLLAWQLVCGRVNAVSAFARHGAARDGKADAEEAESRGWPVARRMGAHLDIVTSPRAVAAAIESVTTTLIGPMH